MALKSTRVSRSFNIHFLTCQANHGLISCNSIPSSLSNSNWNTPTDTIVNIDSSNQSRFDLLRFSCPIFIMSSTAKPQKRFRTTFVTSCHSQLSATSFIPRCHLQYPTKTCQRISTFQRRQQQLSTTQKRKIPHATAAKSRPTAGKAEHHHPMEYRFTAPKQRELCVLVGVELTSTGNYNNNNDDIDGQGSKKTTKRIFDMESSLDELEQLADTAGLQVVGVVTQTLSTPDPSTFIRSGKVSELRSTLQSTGSCTVLFDVDLTPGQQRSLETALSGSAVPTPNSKVVSVIDRTALILDIFAQHASTKEGQLQVELALYQYRLPRLTRLWTHLERQSGAGGVGLRGPGETQLEVDRRLISARVSKLQRELQLVRAHRTRLRSGRRRRIGTPVVALIGYTNAGKSTLLNSLTGDTSALEANALFATLDPTTRQARLPGLHMSPEILITDTVGFVQNLPTQLVAAFRATLEEVVDADLLVHVVDASASRQVVQWQMQAVDQVVQDIGAYGKPTVIALNKIDLVEDEEELMELCEDVSRLNSDNDDYDDGIIDIDSLDKQQEENVIVQVSARTGQGLNEMGIVIEECLRKALLVVHVTIPYTRGDITAAIYRLGCVLSEEYVDDGTLITARVPGAMWSKLVPFMSTSTSTEDGLEHHSNATAMPVSVDGLPWPSDGAGRPSPDEDSEAKMWADLAKKRHSPRQNKQQEQ